MLIPSCFLLGGDFLAVDSLLLLVTGLDFPLSSILLQSSIMLRLFIRNFRTNLPKSKDYLYDLERVEPSNPRYVIDDEHTLNPSETTFKSSSVALLFYLTGGYLVYFCTRLVYDYEWDRFYHVYYPASMEYFDVLSRHYIHKVRVLEKQMPGSIAELLPKSEATPTAKRSSDIKPEEVSQMLETESKIGEALSNFFNKK